MSTLTFLRAINQRHEAREISCALQKGFTLLEVLVALAIMGAALSVLLGAVNKNLILGLQSKNLAIAEILAQKKMAEIELEGFPEVREEEGDFEEAPAFRWFLSINPLEINELGIELRIVDLVITWDYGKKDFSTTLAISSLR